jgi:hypothetical protein
MSQAVAARGTSRLSKHLSFVAIASCATQIWSRVESANQRRGGDCTAHRTSHWFKRSSQSASLLASRDAISGSRRRPVDEADYLTDLSFLDEHEVAALYGCFDGVGAQRP